jgi:hypothetical protein
MFSSMRGWNLITRLGSRILIEVAGPRNGIKQNFITGRNDIIAKQIFWAVIRSQDVMARYKSAGLKNDPFVSSEYVKVLIVNTGMDSVDQMGKKQTKLEERVNTLVKDVKVCEAKSSSASNGASQAKEKVVALSKRVSTMEGKK